MAYRLLHDVAVVEWGEGIAAAFCARLLADLGARVVKVEPPGAGDPTRRAGPFPADLPHPEASGLFLALNTNKLGLTLDPATEAGRRILLRLLEGADVLVEDHRPADLARWGLAYADLARVRPNLVVTSITPFGQDGPYRDFAATDLTLFHMSGYARVMAERVADPEAQPPVRAQGEQVGFIGGLTAAAATAMALLRRRLTGAGAHVDVSLWEAMGMMPQGRVAGAAYGERPRSRRRADNPLHNIVAVLPASDGYVAISPREEDQWRRWVEVMGSPAWAADPRFATRDGRHQHWEELEALVSAWTRQHPKEELYRRAQAHHVPCFPVNTPADLLRSPHLRARGFFQEVEHPVAGRLPYAGAPFKLAEQEPEPDRPAPLLGQHTVRLLSALGLTAEDLTKLRALGVI